MKYLVILVALVTAPLLQACGELLTLAEDCRITAVDVDARRDEHGNQLDVYDYRLTGSCGDAHVRASYNLGTSEAQEKVDRASMTAVSSFDCPTDPWISPTPICVINSMTFSGTSELSQEDLHQLETATAPISAIPLITSDRDVLKGQLANALKDLPPAPAARPVAGIVTIENLIDGTVSFPANAPAPNRALIPIVQMNASGPLVEAVQYLLRHGGAKDIVIDGDFGEQTDGAVRNFQRTHGLVQDGKVGPLTWAKLWVTIRRGAPERDAVRALQVLLNWQGKNVVLDGDFGDQTDGAVRSFQRDMNLIVDGIVGQATWTALLDI